jgi:hypothetical protein
MIRPAVLAKPEARPSPLGNLAHQPRPQRVSFHIPNHVQEMFVFLDRKRLESALIHVTVTHAVPMPLPPHRMRHAQPLKN